MISIRSSELVDYLKSHQRFRIVGCIDVDWIVSQPRKTLFAAFKKWHKPCFDTDERIVLYSRRSISLEMLAHIQRCGSRLDISNFFILLCGTNIDHAQLEIVRSIYSTDNNAMATLDVNFLDPVAEPIIENQAISLPESFCFSPWAHLEISSEGEFKPCCVYKESIKNTNGQPYNVNDHSVTEVYNSEYLTNLRKKFLAGDRPSGCSHCWYKEQTNGKSNRHWLTDYLGLQADLLDIEQEQSINNLISLDLKLGNLCNFKCRICSEGSSSRIAEEKVTHFQSTIDLKSLNAKGRWANNDKIWKMFEQLGKQLINIDFYGGEPFLIKQQETFLDYLIENKLSEKIRLHYNTNGSIYPEHMFEKWKSFREVDIAFSIDNIGKRFELERGGKWEQIENNLSQFQQSKLSNMILSIFTTVNAQNVYYLGELVDWFENKKFNALNFNILENPDFMSITKMGPELTNLAIAKLNQIDKDKLYKYNIFSIIDLLKKNSDSLGHLEAMADYMKKLDNIRHENFYHTHPEIASIIYQGK